MNPTVKKILAVIAGLIVGMISIGLLEGLGHLLIPPPEGLDLTDMKVVEEYLKTAPISALLFVILAWVIGSFLGGAVGSTIGKEFGRTPAYIIGAILTLSGIMNIIMVPHPTWFWLAIVVFIPSALLGFKVVEQNGKPSNDTNLL